MAQRDAPSHALSQFVLKVQSRCDLSCDHCYVYEHADQSWRRQPRTMSPATVRAAAGRIAEHAAAHGLPRVRVVLHGGEPLLLGPDGLRSTLAELTAAIAPVTHLDLRMQSNGVRLSEEICDVLVEYGVRVGISLDGDREANDRHRVFAGRRSSHGEVLRGLELLRRPEYRDAYAGILCTVDVRNDPLRVYDALVAQCPPQVDLLLPHATWDHPPPRPEPGGAVYAAWLWTVHQRWTEDGRPFGIRLFDSLRATGAGGRSTSEWVGLAPADLAVVETDGSWEQVDSLKTAYDGAAGTGLDVFAHPVDAVAALPDVARRQRGIADLSRTCRACPVVEQCGGGLFAHRYRTGAGFDNPSVYCEDLKSLIMSMNEIPTRQSRPPRRRCESVRPSDIPGPVFDQVSTGHGDGAAVTYLAERQLSVTRALLRWIADRFADVDTVSSAWHILAGLDRSAPDAVRSVLAHPYVRPWAVEAARLSTSDHRATPLLPTLAAAAAVGSGTGVDLEVPVRSGTVHLPTVGTVLVPDAAATVRLLVGPDGFTVRCGPDVVAVPTRSRPSAGWWPARRCTPGGLEIAIEDGDPRRDCHDWPVGGRLTDADHEAWAAALESAWRCVHTDAPAYEAGLRAGLRLVTPLSADVTGGRDRSSTARHAFGAVGATLAPGPEFAVMLVHEFQHTKLNALLDLCDLVDAPLRSVRLRVGWREDPRPVEGVLHGIYAHAAVADMWRLRASRATPDDPHPRTAFLRYRDWTATAIDDLFATGALTPAGTAFLGGLADAVATWPT